MKRLKITTFTRDLSNLLEQDDFIMVLNSLIHFLRQGKQHSAYRFDILLHTLQHHPELCQRFSQRLFTWLSNIHIYPALVSLGIFSRSGFVREVGIRVYERFFPSFKDFKNLRDILLYLFYRKSDENWIHSIGIKQWLRLFCRLHAHAQTTQLAAATRHLQQAQLHALEMLSVWIAAEELEPELTRLDPKLLQVESAFVALHHEISKLVHHYRQEQQTDIFDTAHAEVMLAQSRRLVEQLSRKGIGAGAGSSVKVAHLLERLNQSLDRLDLLMRIQTARTPHLKKVHLIKLIKHLTQAAWEQHSTTLLRQRSIKMLARSITQNSSDHGEHYITRNRKEYWSMLYSAAGAGVFIALLAWNKIEIGQQEYSLWLTSLLNGLNYGIGFMLVHIFHCTVASKQPAMTAAKIAADLEQNDKSREQYNKLSKLLIDLIRSQTIAVFGNVIISLILAISIAWHYQNQNTPILNSHEVAYQLQSIEPFTQPTLLYAGIAGIWLFCSGIIAGFFDNRANYLNLRKRLTVQPLLQKILPLKWRVRFAEYVHQHYGSLMANFIFGMLLGLTAWFGSLLGIPLDIRHVAFSSANLGYAAIDGNIAWYVFLYGLLGVLMIGLINVLVSFSLAFYVALRSRGIKSVNYTTLSKKVLQHIKTQPKHLFFPPKEESKTPKSK